MTDPIQLISQGRNTPTLHGGEGTLLYTILRKAAAQGVQGKGSNSGASVGIQLPLIDKMAARDLRDANATHAICVDAKASSTLGLGHREDSIHEILNPLCDFSWQDVLNALASDYWETGECYLELVYGDESDPELVTGLHHIASADVQIEVERENDSQTYHYVVDGENAGAETLVMAKWGDLQDLILRAVGEGGPDRAMANANDVQEVSNITLSGGRIAHSELVHIRQSNNRSRYYGYPDYMSAVPSIELVQCMTQYEFDFYFNRGVPDFLLFLLGQNVGDCWSKIEEMMKSQQGLGNAHKTAAVHIPGDADKTTIQVEKLAVEQGADSGFTEKSGTLDMRVCTAHGMPPQLANIALPGKIGAANEGPNAMLTFQMRKLGQAQKTFSEMFACTLGERKFAQPTGGSASISKDKFLGKGAKPETEDGVPQFVQPRNGFNTILDGMTLGERDTLSTMREPLAGSGRNPSDGKLAGARDRKPADPKASRGPGTGK